MHSFPSLYNENTVISREYTGPLDFDITAVECIGIVKSHIFVVDELLHPIGPESRQDLISLLLVHMNILDLSLATEEFRNSFICPLQTREVQIVPMSPQEIIKAPSMPHTLE